MDRKLSDEQIDRLAKNLLQDFAADNETLDDIAESPRLWWNVRNRIETEKARRARSWFAAFRPQTVAFGALAVFACFGLAALFLNFRSDSNAGVSQQKPVQNRAAEVVKAPEDSPVVSPKTDSKNSAVPTYEKAPVKNIEPKAKSVAKNRNIENSTKQTAGLSKTSPQQAEETKTDFIALSYAANTDSGQVVRVKVPSSMMVSLGVKTNVEKESELVNAEVVIGDDGLARAIRFIR